MAKTKKSSSTGTRALGAHQRSYGTQASALAAKLATATEQKYVDGYYDATALHELSNAADDDWADCEANPRQQTAVYGCLPVPRQGDNYADRDGRRIYVKNIRIKGFIYWAEVDTLTAAGQTGLVRIVVVKDSQTNGATLSAENVIGVGLGSDGQATLSGNGGAISLPSNPDGWGRYKIVYDKTFRAPAQPAFNDGTDGAIMAMRTPFKITIKCKCYQNFSSSTGAVGSVVDNSWHVLAAASDASGAPLLSYYARTSFVG